MKFSKLYNVQNEVKSWKWTIFLNKKSESSSVVSDSLQHHELYSPWNSPGQNTGVGSLSLLQGIFPAHGLNQASWIAGGFLPAELQGKPLKIRDIH